MTSENQMPPPDQPQPIIVEPLFHHKNFWERIRSYFLTGILFIAPLGLTIFITWWFVNKVDQWIKPLIPVEYQIPGLGFLISIVGITIIGALTRGIVGRYFVNTSESVLRKMPVVRSIYSAIKQITETIVSNQSKAFRDVVLAEFPMKGSWAMGFILGDTADEIVQKTHPDIVNVFIATTPNPISGYLLFIPKDQVIYLDMSIEDGLKLVISGGIVIPKEKYKKFSSTRKKNSPTITVPPKDKGV